MRTRAPALRARAVAVVVALVLAGCGSPATDRREDLTGTTVDVLAVWADTEQQRFERVLDGFEELTGATVRYISTEGEDITTVLDGRLATGAVPDVAILPQPGLLRRYAAQGKIWPVDATVTEAVRARYADVWRRLASVDGRLYGVWFKAAHKSLIWYNVGAFERGGAVPPSDLDGLLGVMPSLRASGVAPLAVAGADPWTLTDWFENLYLQLAGPARYDALAEHRLPWT
ncbi:MAG TPA: extracellular solute-binding protein, partial [Acidimicrobiia bacterium]|nr:extracellular solute-binding protein [Acidimicrobiia bacterium]